MFSELLGKTIVSIDGAEEYSEEIIFKCSDGSEYEMSHSQDCCESVSVEDIAGDVENLIGYPILMAEVVSNGNEDEEPSQKNGFGVDSSYTWTYYKLATIKGYVTIRWFGTSNGYYSEDVSFFKINK